MKDLTQLELWFCTGSQHLYGPETLHKVTQNARTIVEFLSKVAQIPCKVIFKPVLTRPEEIRNLCREANNADTCIGLVFWMHTFSPAKMWIAGLKNLHKPFVHLHTQFNRGLPWSSIDMDFMNLNQAAHGDREFGFITARLALPRKIVVGHWEDDDVHAELGAWCRAACGWHESNKLKVARFGDNMREVAVTEGNKVSAEIQFGFSVNGYGIGDLAAQIERVTNSRADELVNEYRQQYTIAPNHDLPDALRKAAKIELGLRDFLNKGGFGAFTDTFQDLHGIDQLPGIAVQRLMADGYGFAGEGDWKTAALVRIMKVMGTGLRGGTSFMEDYTYDFSSAPKVLGSHMLEICPSITEDRPTLEIHQLGIGGKDDPARLVFTASRGEAIVATLVDLGERFRMIVNEVDVVVPDEPLPKLPVARAVWIPRPNLKTAATAWLYAGGAHHTSFSQCISMEILENFAEIARIELVRINQQTHLHQFRRELAWSNAGFKLS